MSTPVIDWSKYENPIDFDALAREHGAITPDAPQGPVAPLPKINMQESLVPKLVRGATESLPAIGGVAGGLVASPTVAGAAFGAGLGTGLGIEAKQLLNRALFGNDEPSTTSGQGLKELGIGMATSAATAGALQGTQNFLLGRVAARSIPANQDWQDLNDVIGATQKSIRMGNSAKSLSDAATMPGRGLANVGFDVDTLKSLNPVERMAAVAPHYKAAGKAIDIAVDGATQSGKILDVGNSAYRVLQSIKNPALQEEAIDAFNSLGQEVGIANQRAASPTEARLLRQALQSGARFGPTGDLNSLSGIRAQLYRSVSGDLHDAVPGLADLDQHYSDMKSAIDAAQRGATRYAMKSVPTPELEPSATKEFLKNAIRHTVVRRVAPYAGGAVAGVAGGYGMRKLSDLAGW